MGIRKIAYDMGVEAQTSELRPYQAKLNPFNDIRGFWCHSQESEVINELIKAWNRGWSKLEFNTDIQIKKRVHALGARSHQLSMQDGMFRNNPFEKMYNYKVDSQVAVVMNKLIEAWEKGWQDYES